jgi:hypothetical protein
MRSGVGAFCVGSRREAWCFLLDFRFLAVVVDVPAEDCCGRPDAAETLLATFAAAEANPGAAAEAYTYTRLTRTTDAAMESLLIDLRFSSLPRDLGATARTIRRGTSFIMMIFRTASSRDIDCGAYRATSAE